MTEDWYNPRPVTYSDKRIPSNSDPLMTEHKSDAVTRFHTTQFAAIVYAETSRRWRFSDKNRNILALIDLHNRKPSYFFAEFMPFCNHWFRNAYRKLDGRLQKHVHFPEFVRQVIHKIDWLAVWNSGEISDDLEHMLLHLNTVLVAQMVIIGEINPDDDPKPRFNMFND